LFASRRHRVDQDPQTRYPNFERQYFFRLPYRASYPRKSMQLALTPTKCQPRASIFSAFSSPHVFRADMSALRQTQPPHRLAVHQL